MNHQILSGPASTRLIMANFSLAVDEAMLTRKISGLQEQLRRIRNKPEHRSRTRYLRQELARLDNVLADVRNLAGISEYKTVPIKI